MAGSWSNSYQTSITLPTGATSGARIVLDGDGDRIFVYNADDQLIASIAPSNGTDPFGNPYREGIVDYAGGPTGEYVQLGFGNVLLASAPDPDDPSYMPVPGEVSIIGDSSRIALQSAANQDLPDHSFIEIVSGVRAAGTGAALYPHHEFRGDIWMLQDLIAVPPKDSFNLIAAYTESGTGKVLPETWHPVTMGSGLAAGPGTGSGYPPLQFRRDGLDNVHAFGVFHATSTSVGPVLGSGLPPVNMANLGGVSVLGGAARMSTTPSQIPLYVNSAGELRATQLPTIAVNDTWMVNASYPQGNIP